jgi:serine phosphatase RsbU (regulator of sigma subunit)
VHRDPSPRSQGTTLQTLVRGGETAIVRVSACARQCGSAGGDFYDLLPLDSEHLGVFIGDVSGHGPTVGPIADATRDLMRLQARRFAAVDPRAMILSLNRALFERLPRSTFVTALFGILHRPSGAFRFVRAGHCRPLLFEEGEVSELAPGGIALGLDPGRLFSDSLETERVVFHSGSRLLLYTDGLVEGWHPEQGIFGPERLSTSLRNAAAEQGTEACLTRVLCDWRRHLDGTPPADDVTVILLAG